MTKPPQHEIDAIAEEFQQEFIKLVHKYAGDSFEAANADLLVTMGKRASVFNSSVWLKPSKKY